MIDFDQSRRLSRAMWRGLDWGKLHDLADYVFDEALKIQAIPAPTFHEAQRAEYMQKRFSALGLTNVRTDDHFNVYGRLPASAPSGSPAVMVVAHVDTVFPQDTDLSVRYDGHLVYGPGLGDNSLGAASLPGVVVGLKDLGLTLKRDVWFVATSREEGLGDLGGMRAAFNALQAHVGAVINLEGMALGHVYHEGIAVRRLHVTVQGEGGHSWAHYGRHSAVHGLMQAGASIAALTPPEKPRTTFNIGMIQGGQSVNTIAPQAEMWLDMRSESTPHLQAFEADVRHNIAAHITGELTHHIEVVGDRPAGGIAASHPLVALAQDALAEVGQQAALATGSTDGNVSLAAGCPTVTLGITHGGNAHRMDEYIERPPIIDGLKQLLLIVAALSADSG